MSLRERLYVAMTDMFEGHGRVWDGELDDMVDAIMEIFITSSMDNKATLDRIESVAQRAIHGRAAARVLRDALATIAGLAAVALKSESNDRRNSDDTSVGMTAASRPLTK